MSAQIVVAPSVPDQIPEQHCQLGGVPAPNLQADAHFDSYSSEAFIESGSFQPDIDRLIQATPHRPAKDRRSHTHSRHWRALHLGAWQSGPLQAFWGTAIGPLALSHSKGSVPLKTCMRKGP